MDVNSCQGPVPSLLYGILDSQKEASGPLLPSHRFVLKAIRKFQNKQLKMHAMPHPGARKSSQVKCPTKIQEVREEIKGLGIDGDLRTLQ